MATERIKEADPRIQEALHTFRHMISVRYPGAVFGVYRGEDPDGVYLSAIVGVEDHR
jgi:hypothetical protein